MKRLLQLAVVAALAVTGLFFVGVHLREEPPSPDRSSRPEASESAESIGAGSRSLPGQLAATGQGAPVAAHPIAAPTAPAQDGVEAGRKRELNAGQLAEKIGREPSRTAGSGLADAQQQTGPAPTFDVVRVNRGGEAVIAGRAEPESEVELTDGERVIGRARADRRGEWVVVPDQPLEPGAREIGIVSRDDGGSQSESESVVVVSVPDPQKPSPAAGSAAESAVAVLVPRDGIRPSRVLQSPTPAASTVSAPAPRPEDPARSPGSTPPQPADSVRIAAIGPSHERRSQATGEEPAVTEAGLSVQTVDYDDAGKVALSGTAEPGAQVKVYLDDTKIGEARADAGGRWEMTPQEDVSPGRYTLRADQLENSGEVAARIRLPFARAEAFRDLEPGSLVVVQPGNSLWRIARRTYGEGERYTVIYRANQRQIDDPDLIYPGQVFSIPEAAQRAAEER